MSDEGKKITGHEYDGIEELDNALPNWWLGILYGTIIFAIGYFFYYSVGDGPTLTQEWMKDKSKLEVALATQAAAQPAMSDDSLMAIVKDPARQKAGQQIFQVRCLPCHGAQGQGGIGPNLTDDYWLHGSKPSQILTTISQGVADKGMPPWGGILSREEVQSVVAFVKSLRGTNPAGAKAPQGELVKE